MGEHSLPAEGLAGILPAADVCLDGFRDFIMHPERRLKPLESRVWLKPPRVQVPPDGRKEVVQGLLARNVCGIMPLSEAFCVGGQPVLGELFWGTKECLHLTRGRSSSFNHGPAAD